MKKMISVIMMTVIVVAMLTACSTKALVDYNNAVVKTDSEKMGKESMEIKINVDYNTEGLSLEKVTQLNHYKEMMFNITNQYDMTQDKIATDIYMNFGGLGMDSYFYKDGDKQYIQIPVLKKYAKLDEKNFTTNNYDKIFANVSDKWLELLGEENVLKGENTIIDTKDGQVKAKEVSIKISAEQLKELSEEIYKSLKEGKIIENFIFISDDRDNQDNIDKEDIIKKIDEMFEIVVFDNFEAKAYIDFDGYLIREKMTIQMSMADQEKGEPMSIQVSIDKTNWDIGKEQEINIPKLNEEDIIELDELKNIDNIIGL
ncbi:hypothetical protein [Vallitalea guaymasensis]|uniref:Lipoprotein n=1 Tax=Vallitalea guaymasensis TaxID=1185412 RepID=A0A8J8MBN0_9FIRM|nr:hypothetical protein [Vallitalea guaymasensis]QUH29931.1 hypothetical protein HYG85_13835 [Vallitalea guaymasensis]